ncbi:MAG TPA: universal stress protein [Gemmataceae bacterium]|nr:universal stress protein [Gemmataceae bacterium]
MEPDLMHRFRRLMVALSRTEFDAGLLAYAATVARLGTAAEVRFAHVLPPGADPDRVRVEMEKAVLPHFADVPGRVTRSFEAAPGPLLDRLLELTAEHETDLLFLGHRPDHPGSAALARRLAMKAACSIWMVPDGSPAMLDRILVPVDFSEHTADALQVAAAMAKLAGKTEVLALHVYFNDSRMIYEEYDRVLRGKEREAFDEFVAPLDLQGIRVTPLFEQGANVAHMINRVALEHAGDLVVMATRGRSRSAAILLGSVTEETITETLVPLLVVKHYGAQLGILRALLEKGFRKKPGPQFD